MKICCFGSLNIDMVFSVEEFVQPGETIRSGGLSLHAGGKGLNQAAAIRKSGADVLMAGSVGPDGDLLLAACDDSGLNRRWVRKVEESSGKAVIQVDRHGENCIILHDGANHKNDQSFMDEVLADLTSGDFLVLQNEINDLDHLLLTAQAKGIQTFLNPSPMAENIKDLPLDKLSCLILNEGEGRALSGVTDPYQIMAVLKEKYPKTSIILTLGKEGLLHDSPKGVEAMPAYPVEAVDTTGAGDAFTGYYIGLLSRGWNRKEALDLAQRAAAISVSRKGAAESIPDLAEVLASSGVTCP